MNSKYARKVRRLLRKAYPIPQPIKAEVSLGYFSKDILLSKRTQELISLYDARLGRMKVDFWVKHQVAVEVHGEQHEQTIRFSNDIEDLEADLARRKGLDMVKQEVLKESGIPILIIWYYEIAELTVEELKNKIAAAQDMAQATTPRLQRATGSTHAPKISRLSKASSKEYRERSAGDNKYNWKRWKSATDLRNLKGNKGRKSLVGRPLPKDDRGTSKLSKDWQQYKDRRKDNG